MHGPGVPNLSGTIGEVLSQSQGGPVYRTYNLWSLGFASGGASGGCAAFNANRVSGAYGAGGAQRVRPRAFAILACTYLGS